MPEPRAAVPSKDAAAKLQICPIVADWKPANPGKPTDAPKYDCATTVAVAKDASGAWSADITALLSHATEGQPVSMMVVPVGTQLAGGLQIPFQINFSGASVPGTTGAVTRKCQCRLSKFGGPSIPKRGAKAAYSSAVKSERISSRSQT